MSHICPTVLSIQRGIVCHNFIYSTALATEKKNKKKINKNNYNYTPLFQMFRFAVISCLVAAALSAPFSAELDSEWEAFKKTHNKQYERDVETLR